MTDPSPSQSNRNGSDRATACTHCGAPATERTTLVFERPSEPKPMDLWLCEPCVTSLTAEPGVHLAD